LPPKYLVNPCAMMTLSVIATPEHGPPATDY
jgi:hypothetical protein